MLEAVNPPPIKGISCFGVADALTMRLVSRGQLAAGPAPPEYKSIDFEYSFITYKDKFQYFEPPKISTRQASLGLKSHHGR